MSLERFAVEARARVARGYYEGFGHGARPRGFADAVRGGKVVAEVKPASPSAGALRSVGLDDVRALAKALPDAGAAALSVLTVPEGFGGSMEALFAATSVAPVPVLMKDFLVDARQLAAARERGASAVLLIPEILRGPEEVAALVGEAHDLDLHVLLEAYDEEGFRRALDTDADVLAVNNRDLRDPRLPIDRGRFRRVLAAVGRDARPVMSLSGCESRADVAAQLAAGADAVLVGSALMRAADPAAALRGLLP